eukprot:10378164-Alexandrium_andersonii.AAC.1
MHTSPGCSIASPAHGCLCMPAAIGHTGSLDHGVGDHLLGSRDAGQPAINQTKAPLLNSQAQAQLFDGRVQLFHSAGEALTSPFGHADTPGEHPQMDEEVQECGVRWPTPLLGQREQREGRRAQLIGMVGSHEWAFERLEEREWMCV